MDRADHGGVPVEPSVEPSVELLEGSREPSRWRARWSALPRGGRLLVGGLVLLLLLGAGAGWFRSWSAEQELRQRVVLSTSLAVWASSTSRPGGELGYFLLVRNDGALPLSVTAVAGSGDGVRLRMREAGDRRIAPGEEIGIPLSVRLTCSGVGGRDGGLPAEIRVRRIDGGSAVRHVDLEPASTLLDVAGTLCGVRPELRDHELTGPVLRDGE
jgi:hypothetical protein